ncbi:hypothetical protein HMPREF0973_02556 [Prevotella veroralis F0319]|uniref:Uncharacterized protein n=1 Tax=Prevotella veroralis F0319 TaxID=649761 RepID=C9MSD7_9BACT|nr:hypothetical protein HMPREF0973_02556 [Prevotella veroralis F0319]
MFLSIQRMPPSRDRRGVSPYFLGVFRGKKYVHSRYAHYAFSF